LYHNATQERRFLPGLKARGFCAADAMTQLSLVRRIKARPSIVFDALTTPEGIAHWWGPDGGPVLLAWVDARKGGSFRVRFRPLSDGIEYETRGEFLELVRPERLLMSWRWEGGSVDPGESRVEIVLRPVPEGTEIVVTHVLLHDDTSRDRHQAGWIGALGRLEAWLTGPAAGAPP
jgi:uncharacterized protein YndB with AHSA1/START domain